jgi:hypothetical protein
MGLRSDGEKGSLEILLDTYAYPFVASFAVVQNKNAGLVHRHVKIRPIPTIVQTLDLGTNNQRQYCKLSYAHWTADSLPMRRESSAKVNAKSLSLPASLSSPSPCHFRPGLQFTAARKAGGIALAKTKQRATKIRREYGYYWSGRRREVKKRIDHDIAALIGN